MTAAAATGPGTYMYITEILAPVSDLIVVMY